MSRLYKPYVYLVGKRPDWMPDCVKEKLSSKGKILNRSIRMIPYWELMLIGFNDVEKQKEWMGILSQWVGEWHRWLREQERRDRKEILEEIVEKVEWSIRYQTSV
jgi:hypothetical protein